MAIRSDISVDWEGSPRVLTVAAPSVEVTIQDLVDTCRYYEELLVNIDSPHLVNAAGKEFLGGTTYVGITATLQNAVLAFEARGGPGWTLCTIAGGNLVAVDEDGVSIDPRLPTAYVSVDRTASASATLQEQDALQYASYGGGVTVDVTSGYSGTEYPVGSPQAPVNNITDAHSIAQERGFGTFFIVGDINITEAIDFEGHSFVGESQTKSQIDIDSDAGCTKCEFYDAHVVGTLDGENKLQNCLITTLNYVNGIVEQCLIGPGTITLGGSAVAHFLDCWSGVPGSSTPIIDMGSSGQELGLRNYSGGVELRNKNGSEAVSIDLNSGQVILDSTVTAGDIVVRGVGKLTDNSVGANVLADDLLSPSSVKDAVWSDPRAELLYNMEGGRWRMVGNQMIFYEDDNVTEVARFNLFDSAGNPTMTNVYDRQRV
jgi:hypothetical protein